MTPSLRLSSRGFTLIELLVVVTIIVVLLAMLVPGLEKSREAAQRAVCASQQRAIHSAAYQYAMDDKRQALFVCRGRDVMIMFDKDNPKTPHPDHAPPAEDLSVNWLRAMSTVGLATREPVPTGKGVNITNAQQPNENPTGMSELQHKPLEMWQCPSSDGTILWNGDEGNYMTTYSWYGGIQWWDHPTEGRRYASRSPERLSRSKGHWVLLADNTFYNFGSWRTTLTNHQLDERGSAGSNQTYFDGSVEWVRPADLVVGHSWNPSRVSFMKQTDRPNGWQVTPDDRASSFP